MPGTLHLRVWQADRVGWDYWVGIVYLTSVAARTVGGILAAVCHGFALGMTKSLTPGIVVAPQLRSGGELVDEDGVGGGRKG